MKNLFKTIPFPLIVIFLLALVLRFLYFPNNIYFGFDQARDAFESLIIAHGHLQILGPTTSYEGIYHGVLYYYLIAPLYLLGQGNPVLLSAFLRIANALGVFIIFFLAKTLFSKKVGLVSALLWAVSFEQTQFSIYMGNPTLASLTVPLMFLGLALTVYSKHKLGLILAAFCLGLSIQFEFALFYLAAPALLILVYFYKSLLKIPLKIWGLSILSFCLATSSFILAEAKFDFRTIKALIALIHQGSGNPMFVVTRSYSNELINITRFNLWADFPYIQVLMVVLLFLLIFLLIKFSAIRSQLIFLSIWFFALFLQYYLGAARFSGEVLYYTNMGISPSLLIFISLLLVLAFNKIKIAGILIILIILANLNLITTLNPKGTIHNINVQQGMLLKDEKEIIDLIYQDAAGQMFATKAITMPAVINTTWSYLYEWYGKNKYGYVPIWGDQNAPGYPGNLQVITAQHALPKVRYLILEPNRGMRQGYIDEYLKIEGFFTDIIWEKQIGELRVQKRVLKS